MASRIIYTQDIVPNGGIDESKAPNKIDDHRWTAGDNVEPLHDGVRLRNGSTAENSTPLWEISLSHEGGTDTREFVDATSEYIAQGFQNDSVAMVVRQIGVRLKKNNSGASPTGNVECAIYDDDTDEPDVETADAVADFGDFSTVDSSTLTDEFKWYYFTLSTAAGLTKSVKYHVVIRHTGADTTGGDTIDIEEVTTPSGYANGKVNFSAAGSTWTGVAAADLNFRIYSAGADITAIADYRLSDGSTSRHLVLADSELYKNVSGTMTSVSARERQGLTSNVNVFPSWAVGQDRFLLTNNTEISKKFYVLSGTEYWENEGIATPTTVPTITNTASGDPVADGTYYVDYYFWNDDIGQPSNRWKDGASTAGGNNEVTCSSDKIAISGLPSTTERENDRATHIRIEIKEPNSSIFRYVTQVSLGTTSVDITGSDTTTVEAEYDHDVPPVHETKCVAENRQFIANVVDNGTRRPYRLMFSAIFGATPYYESFPPNNFRDFGRGDADYITALFFVPPSTLIVGMKNSIRALDARRPKTSDIAWVSQNTGIAHHLAGRVIGQRLFFFSNSAQNIGHYVWEPGMRSPQLIRGIDNTVKNFEDTRYKYASCAALSPGDERLQWWTLHTASGQTQGSKIAVYDYGIGAWTIYTKPSGKLINVLGTVETDGIDTVYAGGYDGVEYKQDSGGDDDGTAYTGQFATKVYDYGAPHVDKRHRRVDVTLATKGDGAIALSTERDYKARSTVATTIDHLDATGTALVWGTGAWGSTIWAGGSDARRSFPLRGRGQNFKHTYSGDDPWHIKSVQYGFQGTEKE